MALGSWSPDGESLTLSIGVDDERLALGVLSTETGEITLRALPESEYSNPAFPRFIGWTPDSSAVFVLHPDRNVSSVLRLDVMSGELTEIASQAELFPHVALSPDGTRLAHGVFDFRPNQAGTYSIDVFQSDGSERSELLRFTDEVPLGGGHGLAWSPDGVKLAYGRLTGSGLVMSQVYVLDEEGMSVQITNGEDGINGSLLWSPKQDALLVVRDICTSCDGFGRKIIFAPVDGTGEVALPGAEGYGHADAAWAPDGERFAYSGDALYVADSDGSTSTPILEIEGASYGPIVWSTDDQIFFIRTSTRSPVAYLVDADGSGIEQFSVGANVSITGEAHDDWPWPTEGRFHKPVWSEDGLWATFVLAVDRESQLMVQDGDGHRILATHTFIQSLTWSPDALSLAYEAEGSVWVVKVDGSEPLLVLEDVTNAGIAWMPDGDRLFATVGESLISVAADGSGLQEEVMIIENPGYEAPQLSVSPDGDAIAIGGDLGLQIGKLSTGTLVKVTEGSIRGLAWSPDSQKLALGLHDTRGTGALPGVYLASRDGLDLRQLTEPSGRLHDVQYWLPEGILFLSHTNFI